MRWRGPRTRAQCASVPRPCRFTHCRYQLATGPNPRTCVLDVADAGGVTLETVAELLGVTRQRVEQVEKKAMRRLLPVLPDGTDED